MNLDGLDFERVSLSKADFSGSSLVKAKLSYVDGFGAIFNGADLTQANLYSAQLNNSSLVGANFTGANLRNAGITEAVADGAQFIGADMKYIRMVRAKLRHADLEEADLEEAKGTDADLFKANLKKGSMKMAELTGANLSHACLKQATLSGVALNGACMDGASLEGAICSKNTRLPEGVVIPESPARTKPKIKKYNLDISQRPDLQASFERHPTDLADDLPHEPMTIAGEYICITGGSMQYSRKWLIEKIEEAGGHYCKSCTMQCTRLVILPVKNKAWKYGNYGEKYDDARIYKTPMSCEDDLIDALREAGVMP